MQYVFLIYGDPRQEDTPELMARYGQFTQDVITGGAMRGGHQLQRAPTARLVRRSVEEFTTQNSKRSSFGVPEPIATTPPSSKPCVVVTGTSIGGTASLAIEASRAMADVYECGSVDQRA